MEEKRNRTPLDLESTEYDVADAGKLDYRLEAGKKDAIFSMHWALSARF